MGHERFPAQRPGAHTDLLNILGNTGDAALFKASLSLGDLRDERNQADYVLTNKRVENEANARLCLGDAFDVIAELNRCRLDAARLAAVTVATRAWVKKLRGIP